MTTTNHTTTFWHFLKNYSVEIPIIQRDYAQGRIGKESLRKTFLNDLKEALDKEKEMKLDFVYGSTENGKLYPLDGQQRLTTLWLLHWYIALKAGKLKDASDRLKNFSYETRVSSRNFCEELCASEHFENYDCSYSVVEFITNQTWFYSAWKQDPTIQSMLRMLGGSKGNNDMADGIEKVFGCSNCLSPMTTNKGSKIFEDYYNLLREPNCPIVFYYLPKDFGNSDDLYIKMNARGEQLTSFENFKADLIGYIKKKAENDNNWDTLLDSNEGLPIKMDTSWTDVFWKNKSKGTCACRMANRIDEIYFAFLNRFFWNELFIAKAKDGKYLLDIGKGDENSTKENDNVSYKYLNDSDNPNDNDTKIAYKGFDVYQYDNGIIPISFFKKMKKVLNNVSAYLIGNPIPNCPWDEKFHYIPEYDIDKDRNNSNVEITNNASDRILKVTILNQIQRIVFFSICKYFDYDNTITDDDKSLKRWLRVVWNLVSGEDENGRPQIRSTQAVRTAIGFIEKLDRHDVYNSLITYKGDLGDSDFDERCKEEIAKAKQILDEDGKPRKYNGEHTNEIGEKYDTWEEIIFDAESYYYSIASPKTTFFKGTIRFLFTNENGNVNSQSWQDFDAKWTNAQQFFNKGVVTPTIRIAEYFCDEQIKDIFSRYSFNTKNWKQILIQKSISKSIHQFLIGETINNTSVLYTDIKNILESINTQDVWLLQDWHHCEVVLTNYLTRRSEPYNGYVFQVGNEVRNKWNNVISKISEIEVRVPQAFGDEKIENNGQAYYRGLWTDIKYRGHYFRYFGNNTICLMTDNWIGKKLKNENEGDTPENTYYFEVANCFDETENVNVEKMLNNLKGLITQAVAD